MVLSLIDKGSLAPIGEMEVDFIPTIGEVFVYNEGTPEEALYKMEKVLKPTLFRNGSKYYKVLVLPA